MIIKWEEACKEIENLKKIVRELHQENEKLTTTVTSKSGYIYVLTSKLEKLAKYIRIYNKAQDMSDRIIEDEEKSRISVELLKDMQVEEKKPRNFVVIGFDYIHMNKKDHFLSSSSTCAPPL